MPRVNVNGQNLFYEDSGGPGPVIVFSHGLLMDHTMFDPQVAALKDRYRCIAWDERGHGQTAGQRLDPFTYYDSANDLAALLRHLGIKSAILAGMSQGGFLSLRCALTHPELVRALILIDTQAGQEAPEAIPQHNALAELWMTSGLSDDIASVIEGIILGQGWDGAPAWKAKWKTYLPANIRACMATLTSRDDITGRLGEIKAPALVIHGDADAAIELTLAETLTAGLGGPAELVVVKGGGHASNLTHPVPTNAAIERFLGALPV